MYISRLNLVSFRGFKQLELDFDRHVNVIAGVNGAGKSSILHAVCLLLSHALPTITLSKETKIEIDIEDIRHTSDDSDKSDSCDLSIDFAIQTLAGKEALASYEIHFNRTKQVEDENRRVREEDPKEPNRHFTPDRYDFKMRPSRFSDENYQPFGLLFSPTRSVISDNRGIEDTGSRTKALFRLALVPRPLQLRLIAKWWLYYQEMSLEPERANYARHLEALDAALKTFLGDIFSVFPQQKVVIPKKRTSAVEHIGILKAAKQGAEFDMNQMSDGERGMLALVLETARRLILAYPALDDPIRDGSAVILIDEIELHLHPKWQREVIKRLGATFPNCQFIITTHSALVLSQVHKERVTIIGADGQIRKPLATYGVAPEDILEGIQGVAPPFQQEIDAINSALDDFEIEQAQQLLAALTLKMDTPNPTLSELEALIGNTKALLEDAENTFTDEELT